LVKKKTDITTEKAILAAARKVFTHKGFAAARMEDIAAEAGINRALLHYYFRSKEKMFDIIFEQRIAEFFTELGAILTSERNLQDKIRAIVDHDIQSISEQPDLPMFIMQELGLNPQRLIAYAEKAGSHPRYMIKILGAQVKQEVAAGRIRNIDPGQLLINIMSLSVYPFIAKPMIKAMQEMDNAGFETMMKKRKKEVADFILSAITVSPR
jgi:AcrR family transcriptional regulator